MKINVLRPKSSRGPFRWVHLDDGEGRPLCGDTWYPCTEEVIEEESADLCFLCARISNGYSVETIRSGQERAYGDSEYVYHITDLQDPPRPKEEVLAFCQKYVKRSYRKSEMPNWSSPEMMQFSSTGPGQWHYRVRMEFTG